MTFDFKFHQIAQAYAKQCKKLIAEQRENPDYNEKQIDSLMLIVAGQSTDDDLYNSLDVLNDLACKLEELREQREVTSDACLQACIDVIVAEAVKAVVCGIPPEPE